MGRLSQQRDGGLHIACGGGLHRAPPVQVLFYSENPSKGCEAKIAHNVQEPATRGRSHGTSRSADGRPVFSNEAGGNRQTTRRGIKSRSECRRASGPNAEHAETRHRGLELEKLADPVD